ncbi:serine/threonine protein kinase, partial [Candidatus Micrarchaeota archaeon]|nr:serine/threonine protein kinase [Candidatus Micrarchaeota archaeon]
HIATGGISEVFLADDLKSGKKAALKIPRSDEEDPVSASKLFDIESRALFELRKVSGVVSLISHGPSYVVLDYLGEKNLHQNRRLNLIQTMNIFLSACNVLSEIHSAGIVHRDVKPGNMFITGPSFVTFIDFHYAVLPKPGISIANPIGTAEYFSPEQTYLSPSDNIDCRADIYSLGVSLYLMAARIYRDRDTYPFDFIPYPDRERRINDCILKHRNASPVELSRRIPEIPKRFSDAIMKALEKDRQNRYQSTSEMKEALSKSMKHIT